MHRKKVRTQGTHTGRVERDNARSRNSGRDGSNGSTNLFYFATNFSLHHVRSGSFLFWHPSLPPTPEGNVIKAEGFVVWFSPCFFFLLFCLGLLIVPSFVCGGLCWQKFRILALFSKLSGSGCVCVCVLGRICFPGTHCCNRVSDL